MVANDQCRAYLLDFLRLYETSSGQRVNASKSCFLLSKKAPERTRLMIHSVIGYIHKDFPLKYLGVPLVKGRFKIGFYYKGGSLIRSSTESMDGVLLCFQLVEDWCLLN